MVRAQGAPETAAYLGRGRDIQAVHGELEVAIQMTRFTLRRFGVSAPEVDAIANGLRTMPVVARDEPAVTPLRWRGLEAVRSRLRRLGRDGARPSHRSEDTDAADAEATHVRCRMRPASPSASPDTWTSGVRTDVGSLSEGRPGAERGIRMTACVGA